MEEKLKYMAIEKLYTSIKMKKQFKKCKEDNIESCSLEKIDELRSKRDNIFTLVDKSNADKVKTIKKNHLDSLRTAENKDEKVLSACCWKPEPLSSCQIDSSNLNTFIDKSTSELGDMEINTLDSE